MEQRLRVVTSILLASILLVSFALHGAQVEHTHAFTGEHVVSHTDHSHGDATGAQASSESLSDKMHMADKKMFVLVISLVLLFKVFIQSNVVSFLNIERIVLARITNLQRRYLPRSYSHIALLYKAGVLNPKLF